MHLQRVWLHGTKPRKTSQKQPGFGGMKGMIGKEVVTHCAAQLVEGAVGQRATGLLQHHLPAQHRQHPPTRR